MDKQDFFINFCAGRRARTMPVTMPAKIISIIATAIMIAAVVTLLVRRSFFATGPLTIGLQIVAVLLMLWARFTFGVRSFHFAANPTEGDLITHGPYRYIRNPIYAAVLLVCWAGVAAHWSLLNMALGIIIAATLIVKIYCEEMLLRQSYPEYRQYADHTPRLVPCLF